MTWKIPGNCDMGRSRFGEMSECGSSQMVRAQKVHRIRARLQGPQDATHHDLTYELPIDGIPTRQCSQRHQINHATNAKRITQRYRRACRRCVEEGEPVADGRAPCSHRIATAHDNRDRDSKREAEARLRLLAVALLEALQSEVQQEDEAERQ